MKLGVVFPQTEIGSNPIVIRDYAQAVEGLGFDHLLAFDHVLGAHPDRPGGWTRPYDWQTHFHEPLVLFGYLAGLTERLELVTNIIILPQRHRVYEINRNFRNEGISTQHNPEFTMLELYQAWVDYAELMDLTETLFVELEQELLGKEGLRWHGERLDLARPWPRLTVREAITAHSGVPPERLESVEALQQELAERRIEPPPVASYGHLLMTLFEETVEDRLIHPTFILEYPVEVSPLAKHAAGDHRFVERFELYVGGMELANAFSELNDPTVQAERFRQQLAVREAGDLEAHGFDADFVRALEHGMPPAAGEGIGIDRLTMLFADRPSIRDVILFPLMRPVPEEAGADPRGSEEKAEQEAEELGTGA